MRCCSKVHYCCGVVRIVVHLLTCLIQQRKVPDYCCITRSSKVRPACHYQYSCCGSLVERCLVNDAVLVAALMKGAATHVSIQGDLVSMQVNEEWQVCNLPSLRGSWL